MIEQVEQIVGKLTLDMHRLLDKELSKENRSIFLNVRDRSSEYRIAPVGFLSEVLFERLTGKTHLSIPKPDPTQPGLFDDLRS